MSDVNIYCDESCHLENDGINVMTIGCVYCPIEELSKINSRVKEIKEKYGVRSTSEVKWTKVSNTKKELYKDLVNYFFDDDDLHLRCLIADKTKLNHQKYNQTHNDWYYKMYFDMLKVVFDPTNRYNVYIDIKDDYSFENITKLHEYSCNNQYDFSHRIIKKMQPIRSHEVQIMQLTDILIGAIAYVNRVDFGADHVPNKAKLEIIDLIRRRSGYDLKRKTLYRENKINLLFWGKF